MLEKVSVISTLCEEKFQSAIYTTLRGVEEGVAPFLSLEEREFFRLFQ